MDREKGPNFKMGSVKFKILRKAKKLHCFGGDRALKGPWLKETNSEVKAGKKLKFSWPEKGK